MKKSGPLSRALISLLLLGAGACAKKEQIVIFATGRSQGRLWAEEAPGASERAGGLAVFKSLYDQEKLPKLAVDTGNWFSATPEGWLTRGRSTLACFNAVPYTAAAPGLEDLALTPQELQKLAESSAMPLLASNLYLKTNKKPPFLFSSRIVEAGGRKVGIFSLLINSPSTPNKPKYLPNYKLEKETYEAQRAIKALRDEGAQLIVMLLGVNPREKASQDFFRDLLSKLPRIDLVITDEPSVKKPFRVNRAWVAGAGLEMASAARLGLRLDRAGKMTGLSWKKIPLSAAKYGEDPGMLKVIGGFRKSAAAHFSRRVGFLSAALPLSDGGVSPAADFAADCMRRWAKTNAAIIGLKEPAAGFSSGTVTVGDLYASFPLDSSVVFVKIRGDDLERALSGLQPGEISVSGLRLFLRSGALERTETDSGPLVPGHIYRLAVPDSLASGRENPLLSSAMEFANSRRYLREVMGWCFSRQKSFSRPAGGRIVQAGDK
ncbi:MAG: 5'-nucleotidase C-terminal domain-containing protein [Elusimicrobiota bacterium]|nr:5'-nucleotidase C-terminal domain-containing protein [Elusimicrobiota bacterium]